MEPSPIRDRSLSRGGTPRRHWLTLFALTLALLLPTNLRAALQFDAFLGLDSYVPEGCWFPIVCEVHNDGPAFNGVIEVTGGMGQGGFPRLVPVELPTGTRKRITIPVFSMNSYNRQWDVRLKDSNGKLRAEAPNLYARDIVQRSTVLVGSLSRLNNWTPTFKEPLSEHRNFKPVAARFLPDVFPDNALVLEGMKALYLSSEKASALRAQQAAAIQSWINSGGHLVVGVDQVGDINSLPWLRALIPMDLSGVRQVVPGESMENWLRSPVKDSILHRAGPGGGAPNRSAQVKATTQAPYLDTVNDASFGRAELSVVTGRMRGGETVIAVGDTPILVSAIQGLGRVSVLLVSPEREPFKSWRNQPAFWSRLAEAPPRIYASAQSYYPSGSSVDGVFGAMVDSRQVRKLPIGWLFLMLIAYLAIIGPVDQIWLRKIGKPMLTWITFPCYVALFSGLIYLVGYKLRAGESEWNELHVVDVFPSGTQAELRGRTFGSVYSPVNQRYNFESKAGAASFRGEHFGNYNTSGGNDRGKIVQSESAFQAEVFVPVWTCQLYVSDWLQPADLPFVASVEKVANGWKATVQNKLDKPLTHVRLVVAGNVYELPEIPARQVTEFTAGARQFTRLSSFVGPYGNQFKQAIQQRRSAFGGTESGRLNNLPDCSMAASFVAHLNDQGSYDSILAPPSFDLSGAAEQDNAILLAWEAGQAPIKSMNQFTPRRKQVNTLWRMTLPLAPTP